MKQYPISIFNIYNVRKNLVKFAKEKEKHKNILVGLKKPIPIKIDFSSKLNNNNNDENLSIEICRSFISNNVNINNMNPEYELYKYLNYFYDFCINFKKYLSENNNKKISEKIYFYKILKENYPDVFTDYNLSNVSDNIINRYDRIRNLIYENALILKNIFVFMIENIQEIIESCSFIILDNNEYESLHKNVSK